MHFTYIANAALNTVIVFARSSRVYSVSIVCRFRYIFIYVLEGVCYPVGDHLLHVRETMVCLGPTTHLCLLQQTPSFCRQYCGHDQISLGTRYLDYQGKWGVGMLSLFQDEKSKWSCALKWMKRGMCAAVKCVCAHLCMSHYVCKYVWWYIYTELGIHIFIDTYFFLRVFKYSILTQFWCTMHLDILNGEM